MVGVPVLKIQALALLSFDQTDKKFLQLPVSTFIITQSQFYKGSGGQAFGDLAQEFVDAVAH